MIYKINKKTLQLQNILLSIIIWFTIIFGVIGTPIYYVGFQNGKNHLKNLSPEETLIIVNDYDKFTPEKFKIYLNELNVPHVDIVYAQSVIETGNFTSNIFKFNNNLFGLKRATQRPTTNKGEDNNHAYYLHWRQSVQDYALYSCKYLSNLNREQYLEYLRKNYAEDPNYINKIKQIINK